MPEAAPRARRRRWPWALFALAVLAGVAVCALRWYADPARLTALLASKIGSSLGAEFVTGGSGRYAFVPRLSLRLPGPALKQGDVTIARADALAVVVPWSTLWSNQYRIDRIELVRPVLDLDALRAWLGARPPSAAPPPDVRFALHVEDGTLVAGGVTLARGVRADFATLGDLAAWLATLDRQPAGASLLPPARGTLDAKVLDVGGVHLEGVHVELRGDTQAPPKP